MSDNMKKIYDLQKALENIGISTDLNLDAEWLCIDHQLHYGIELETDMTDGEYYWSFMFTPTGEYIEEATQAPVRKKGKK